MGSQPVSHSLPINNTGTSSLIASGKYHSKPYQADITFLQCQAVRGPTYFLGLAYRFLFGLTGSSRKVNKVCGMNFRLPFLMRIRSDKPGSLAVRVQII
jgi:hypothetical protein